MFIDENINVDSGVLTSEPSSDREIISSLNNRPEKPAEHDNRDKIDTPDEGWAVRFSVQRSKNYMVLNNSSSKTNVW